MDEIPVGWIKETRSRRYAGGFVTDTFYTDPISGYVFRSKKDVLRYMETGNISTCAIKPRRRHMTAIPAPPSVGNNGAGLHGRLPDNSSAPHSNPNNGAGSHGRLPENSFAPHSNPNNGAGSYGRLPENSFAPHSNPNNGAGSHGRLPENSFAPHSNPNNGAGSYGRLPENSFAPHSNPNNGAGSHGRLPDNLSAPYSNPNLGSFKRKSIDLPHPSSKKLVGFESDVLPSSGLTETRNEANPSSLADIWFDPSYIFAFRTLMDEIPIEYSKFGTEPELEPKPEPEPEPEPFSQSQPRAAPSLDIPTSNIQAISQTNVSPNSVPVVNENNVDQFLSQAYHSLKTFFDCEKSPIQSKRAKPTQLPLYRPRAKVPLPSVAVPELPASNILAYSQNNVPVVNKNPVNQLVRCDEATLFSNQSSSQLNNSSMNYLPNFGSFKNMKSMDQSLGESSGLSAVFPNYGNAGSTLQSFNMAQNSNLSLNYNNFMLDSSAYYPLFQEPIFPTGATSVGLPQSCYNTASFFEDFDPFMGSSSQSSSSRSTVVAASNVNVPAGGDDPAAASEYPRTQAESKMRGN